ncbi:MAG: YceI family protein [Cyclobacteriaceae bacterium]|jgi:polyisoprenoid-binding protein YceI|nr:YceI family protein [Flammeovirgaceae bacterium]
MNSKINLNYVPLVFAAIFALLAFIIPPAAFKYKVDTNASTLNWVGKKVTGQHNGSIALSSGEIVTEGKTIKQGSFEIDVNSITVADITDKDGNAKLVSHLKSDDFFATEKFPKATFVIGSVISKSANEYIVKGKLTMKGITNDIEFPATITNDGKQIAATAKIIVDRSKFDIRFRSRSFFENLGDKVIYDEFELDLKLIAILQSGS